MSETPNDSEQPTIESYLNNPAASHRHLTDIGDKWQCDVCGFDTDDSNQVAACHPGERLDRERTAAVSTTTGSQTGFIYPPQLFDEIKTFFKRVEQAVQQADAAASPLQAATEIIRPRLDADFPGSKAFELYTYLVFCQQHQLLPGYPQYTNTDSETVSIKKFCTHHPQFEGSVTDGVVADSELIRTERIYRTKVQTTTSEFLAQDTVFPVAGATPWEYQTTWEVGESLNAMGIFGEGTAHNTVAIATRDWLAAHPKIDWAVTPHTMGNRLELSTQQQHSPKFSTDARTEPPEHPVTLFDAAGFADQQPPRLKSLCTVVTDNQHRRTILELNIAARSKPHAYAIAVMPDRESIEEFIVAANAADAFPHDPAPDRDTREQYSRLPNISAINEELTRQAFETPWIRFLTRKQLTDGLVDPEELISLPNPTADE